MKILLQIIFMLITSVCISCNDSEAIAGKPEAKIAQFTLQCGGTYYRGNINDENKVIRISGITNRKAITGVNYQLSGGASISPDPQKVKRWETEQQFTVTSSDYQLTSEYTVLLPELQEEPETSHKVVIGYLPAHDFDFDAQFDKNFTQANQLDGFDIDYEDYNHWNTNSLVAFAEALHEAKSADMLMTCAVICWKDYTTKWQEYFDYINIMSYDRVMGNSSTPGQHASYNDFVNDMNYWITKFQAPKSKIVGGLPFYGYSWDNDVNKDEVGAIRFNGILTHFGKTYDIKEIADADQFGKTYYNGRPTIRKKCQYVMDNDFGGVMIWQLFQDAYQEELKLIKVVGEVIMQE